MVGVTGQQGVLTPPRHLIPYLVCPRIRFCSTLNLVFFIRFTRLITVRYLHFLCEKWNLSYARSEKSEPYSHYNYHQNSFNQNCVCIKYSLGKLILLCDEFPCNYIIDHPLWINHCHEQHIIPIPNGAVTSLAEVICIYCFHTFILCIIHQERRKKIRYRRNIYCFQFVITLSVFVVLIITTILNEGGFNSTFCNPKFPIQRNVSVFNTFDIVFSGMNMNYYLYQIKKPLQMHCSTKVLSIILTKMLTAVKEKFQPYCAQHMQEVV